MMKKQILLMLMYVAATFSAIAVSLPSTSYNTYNSSVSNDIVYTLGTGTTFVNQSVVGVGDYSHCVKEESAEVGTFCYDCCSQAICPGEEATCVKTNPSDMANCIETCQNPHLGTIDANTMLLLALIAAYGAIAVYRRKMQVN